MTEEKNGGAAGACSGSGVPITVKLERSKTKNKQTLLNQYIVENELGSGAYSTVHLALDSKTDQLVALKTMSKNYLSRKHEFSREVDESGMMRMVRSTALDKVYSEIEIHRQLEHPNICKLIEIIDDIDDDSLILVLELCEDGEIMEWKGDVEKFKCTQKSLETVDSKLTEKSARKVVKVLLDVLEYLRDEMVVHRDLKPPNILLTKDGCIKLTDFGVAKSFKGQEPPHTVSDTNGTHQFISPESVSGEDFDPFIAEIWSLGVVLYCFIFGITPFYDKNIQNVFEKIETDPVTFDDKDVKTSDSLRNLFAQILEKDPSKRFTIEQIRDHEWMKEE